MGSRSRCWWRAATGFMAVNNIKEIALGIAHVRASRIMTDQVDLITDRARIQRPYVSTRFVGIAIVKGNSPDLGLSLTNLIATSPNPQSVVLSQVVIVSSRVVDSDRIIGLGRALRKEDSDGFSLDVTVLVGIYYLVAIRCRTGLRSGLWCGMWCRLRGWMWCHGGGRTIATLASWFDDKVRAFSIARIGSSRVASH